MIACALSVIWHKLLKLLITHALILDSNILIKVTYSQRELLFQKIWCAGADPRLNVTRTRPAVVIDEKDAGYRRAAAEGEQQRRTKGSVIRVVGNAFPDHPQADQHRREEGEQGGGDKNAGHGDASESAYAIY